MTYLHPYSRYGLALVMCQNELVQAEDVTHQHLQSALIESLGHFRVKPVELIESKQTVRYVYMKYEFILNNKFYQGKGKTDEGIFLAPNIISSDKGAGQTWSGVCSLIGKLNTREDGKENVTMSLYAASAKFNNGNKSQSPPKATLTEVACAAITNTTLIKPCLTYKTYEKGRWHRTNTAIIPDLPLPEMIRFIALFKMMLVSDSVEDLMYGKVYSQTVGKGNEAKTLYSPWRPNIFDGNFPNPPRSSALGSVALLGAIGEWSKRADKWAEGQTVLDSLISVPIYMVSYGNARTFTFNHHVITLAKEGKLSTIVDSIFYVKLFNTESRSHNKNEYESFDLFASHFLQFFNRPSFNDFMAFRGEYPYQLDTLFNTYFTKMENIPMEVVHSAKELGRWLNYVAYITAKGEYKNTKSEEFKKSKAKVLVEIESSIFSAKSGNALIAQVITRAGRLSGMDAPPEATLYVEQTCSGDLTLENAKNLLMAFSRLRNKFEKSEPIEQEIDKIPSDDSSEYEET